jgi:hypothetical protein
MSLTEYTRLSRAPSLSLSSVFCFLSDKLSLPHSPGRSHGTRKRAKSPSDLLTRGHGILLSYRLQPYLSLLYHVPAARFLSDEWRKAESSRFTDLDALDDLVRSGVSVLRVETASAPGQK